MKNLIRITLLLLVATAGISGQHKAKGQDTAKDEAAIRANVEQMVKGWNAKSGADFARSFAEVSDYVVVNGLHLKGREANAAAHQRIFDTIYKASVLAATVEDIRFLRPDVAVVHVLSRLSVTGPPEAAGSSRITLVMTRDKGGWHIEAFQNTRIQMEGGK